MIINFEEAIAQTKEKFSFLVLFSIFFSGKRNRKMKFYNLNEVSKTSADGGPALRRTGIELHINEDKRLKTRRI